MCGICGRVNRDPERPVLPEELERMAGALRHRGPDDQGYYRWRNVGLGMRRLSIIDVAGGQQPIANEGGDVWIVCNGEIYNFQDLGKELEGRGHRFRTRSDTEVIAHLYEERGTECVRALRGMFAFALWDQRQGRLVLARDRVGKKPLLYALRNGDLVFASELKALLGSPGLAGELDLESLDEYLSVGYVPHPQTIFQGILKLPPGHLLTWEAGLVKLERYWRLDFAQKNRLGPAEALARVEELLLEATRIRLMSEVPLGALLSGGVDSSAVVAAMSRLTAAPVRTFSIGFEGDPADELPHARDVARRFGTMHTEFTVRPDLGEVLPRLAWAFDEPFADSSALPSFYVCQMARRQVTVALNGDGGDEAFAGYARYRKAVAAPAAARRYPWLVRGHFSLGEEAAWRRCVGRQLRRWLVPDAEAAVAPDYFDGAARWALYRPAVRASLAARREHAVHRFWGEVNHLPHPLDRMLATDIEWYLPDDLLFKMDIASMAHSLEARSPFLDHRLLEFAASLPADLKCPGGELKGLLKRVVAPWLGEAFVRRPKRGFAPPLRRWLRHELREFVRETLLLTGRLTRLYLEPGAVERLWREHVTGRRNHARRLWALLMLELWHREYVEGASPHRGKEGAR